MGYVGSAIEKTFKALWGWHPKLHRGQPKPNGHGTIGKKAQTPGAGTQSSNGESTQNLMEVESKVPKTPLGMALKSPWGGQPESYGCSSQNSVENASQMPQGRQ